MRHKSTQELPVDLPVGFNAWLLECAPIEGCASCRTAWQALKSAEAAGHVDEAAKHAAKVRDHSGRHR